MAIRYSPLPEPRPVIPFTGRFVLEGEFGFASVPPVDVKYPTCGGY